jgi:hypothetical protein
MRGKAVVVSRVISRNHEHIREILGILLLLRGTAAEFLLDPALHVGGDVLDTDSGLHAAEELHGLAVDKRHIRHVEGNAGRALRIQSFLQLRHILTRKLSTQVHPEGLGLVSGCRNLQHAVSTCTLVAIIQQSEIDAY